MFLISTGSYLPGSSVSNEMLSDYFGNSVHLIADYFGIKSRHMAVDYKTGQDSGEYTSDFCTKAALDAVSKVPNFDLKDVDLVITSSSTPDYVLPSLSSLVQEKLGLPNAFPIDIRGGCSGSLQALLIAELFIKTGKAKNALVIGGECCSTIYYDFLFKQRKSYNAKDLINTLIFGDGASAFLVGGEQLSPDNFEIETTVSESVLPDQVPGFIFSYGGAKEKILGQDDISLSQIFRHYPKEIERNLPRVIRAMQENLRKTGYQRDDFKYIVGPQANKRLIDDMNLLLKEHKADYFYYGDVIGNIPGGALFLAFDRLVNTNQVSPGDRVLIMGMESPKWLYGYCVLKKG